MSGGKITSWSKPNNCHDHIGKAANTVGKSDFFFAKGLHPDLVQIDTSLQLKILLEINL